MKWILPFQPKSPLAPYFLDNDRTIAELEMVQVGERSKDKQTQTPNQYISLIKHCKYMVHKIKQINSQ